jgi:hypothetical protein
MIERSLGDVLAEILDGCRRYPALMPHAFHALMDANGLRDGVLDIVAKKCDIGGESGAAALHLDLSVRPTPWLIQFAHAISQGVVPELPLPEPATNDTKFEVHDEFKGEEFK